MADTLQADVISLARSSMGSRATYLAKHIEEPSFLELFIHMRVDL